MALVSIAPDQIIGVQLSYKTLSGNVLSSAVPVSRTVLVYKNGSSTLYRKTESDAVTGDWTTTVISGNYDTFRVIVVGEPGEYSRIFEHVVAG